MTEKEIVDFDKTATDIFAPVYPSIAAQILEKTGVSKGRCLDIGSGGGHLGIALALITSLEVCLLDKSGEVLKLALKKIGNTGLKGRIRVKTGIAENLPFPDGSFDLVISRGSIDFWDDKPKGLKEAYRVLKAGGRAYIGGGFGSADQRIGINRLMGEKTGIDEDSLDNPYWRESVEIHRNAATGSGIKDCQFISDNAGMWIIFGKPGE
jgi:SAM-dependent methyltransferase